MAAEPLRHVVSGGTCDVTRRLLWWISLNLVVLAAAGASTRGADSRRPGAAPLLLSFSLLAHLLRLASAVACGLLQQTASEGEPQVENRAVESDVGYLRARALELSAPGTRAVTRAQSSRVQSLAARTSRGADALALGVDARVHQVV